MYINVITFTNGKTLAFQTKTPYSVDKVNDSHDKYNDWNLVTDDHNGQIISFRGAEIVTIATSKVPEKTKRGLTTKVTTE